MKGPFGSQSIGPITAPGNPHPNFGPQPGGGVGPIILIGPLDTILYPKPPGGGKPFGRKKPPPIEI